MGQGYPVPLKGYPVPRKQRGIGTDKPKEHSWQIVALATLCFIQAFHLVEAVLGYLLSSANHANVVDWAELGAQDGDVNQIYETLALISDV